MRNTTSSIWKNSSKDRQAMKKRRSRSMKRTLLWLGAAGFVLILLAGGLVLALFSKLNTRPAGNGNLESYLAEHWPVFHLRAWDAETGALDLDYPLRFTYAQMEKYGASMEELRTLPEGNLDTVSALKTAAREAVGVTVRRVTVYGMTTDGQVAYTVQPDGVVTACWSVPQ